MDVLNGVRASILQDIQPLEGGGPETKSRKLFTDIEDAAIRHASPNEPDAETKDYIERFEDAVDRAVHDKEVPPAAARIFLRKVLHFHDDKEAYSALVYRNRVPTREQADAIARNALPYQLALSQLRQSCNGDPKWDGETFQHFNKESGGEEATEARLYVSFKPEAHPQDVLNAWREALKASGLATSLHFKTLTKLKDRHEGIIAYLDGTEDKRAMLALMDEFLRRADPADLDVMDTAIPVAHGLTLAPEPAALNGLLLSCGKDTQSYHGMVSEYLTLSFAAALRDMEKTASRQRHTPETVAPIAKEYFAYFMRLSGLDPKTMLSRNRNLVPAWMRAA